MESLDDVRCGALTLGCLQYQVQMWFFYYVCCFGLQAVIVSRLLVVPSAMVSNKSKLGFHISHQNKGGRLNNGVIGPGTWYVRVRRSPGSRESSQREWKNRKGTDSTQNLLSRFSAPFCQTYRKSANLAEISHPGTTKMKCAVLRQLAVR